MELSLLIGALANSCAVGSHLDNAVRLNMWPSLAILWTGVNMSLAVPLIYFIALFGAIICGTKAVWHAFGMIRGVRSSSEWWVNLVPFVALAHPGTLDPAGQAHRDKFVVWVSLALAFALVTGLFLGLG